LQLWLSAACCGFAVAASPLVAAKPIMKSLSFKDVVDRLARWEFPGGIDGVVGIAQGGVVPAALVAQRLGLELKLIALNYRDEAHEPRFAAPKLLSAVPDLGAWKRVLLVDDVYVSGKSWQAARALLPPEVEVLPFVLKGQGGVRADPRCRRLRGSGHGGS
jgi:adenine/guanine phosphoribosyltransferase-like PRPP-binding protein